MQIVKRALRTSSISHQAQDLLIIFYNQYAENARSNAWKDHTHEPQVYSLGAWTQPNSLLAMSDAYELVQHG